MPLDKFVLLLVIVVAAAGITVWLATLVVAAAQIGDLDGWSSSQQRWLAMSSGA